MPRQIIKNENFRYYNYLFVLNTNYTKTLLQHLMSWVNIKNKRIYINYSMSGF